MPDPAPSAAPADFAGIRRMLRELPGPDAAAAARARAREATLAKPAGSLGRLEDLAHWVAAWRGAARIDRPRIAVFAGNHGVARHRVSAYPPEVTAQMVRNFVAGGAAVNQLAKAADADLRVYEMALNRPTADISCGPAMDEATCAGAMAYGMTAVEDGVDLLAVGEMGIANTTAASALACALLGGAPRVWTGPGTGLGRKALQRKTVIVARALAANAGCGGDPLQTLAALGGRELAAIAGAVLAARMARVPVLLDGFVATAAAAVLHRLDAGLLDHCRAAHRSAEPAHGRMLGLLGLEPLLDFGMRLGEASGAALAIPLVRAAVACHAGMATFESAGVSNRSPAPGRRQR